MSKFQVAVVTRPKDWKPACADDLPPAPGQLGEPLSEHDDLFAAVREAVAFNEVPERTGDDRWAVVVQRGTRGRQWTAARLCTPIVYKVTAIWRPEGWEPDSPLDVPNCIWKSHNRVAAEPLCYAQAVATIRALNQQNMDVAGDMWYVLMAVEMSRYRNRSRTIPPGAKPRSRCGSCTCCGRSRAAAAIVALPGPFLPVRPVRLVEPAAHFDR